MGAIPVIGVKCHYCSKFYPKSEVVHFGEDGHMHRCLKCHETHVEALDALATQKCPDRCAECRESCESIHNRTGQATLFLHWKDGIYQFLCSRCARRYAEKRKDIFGHTRFGYETKIS